MAKLYLSQLQKKYNFKDGEVTGLNYRKLMKDIIANQSLNISRATSRLAKDSYEKQIKELKKRIPERGKEKRIILPDVSEVLPKRSIFIRKGAEDGNILTDKLRDLLTKKLRESLDNFKIKSGEKPFIYRRGKKAGRINTKVIDYFSKEIKTTFENYTKNDPKYGVPKNIHQIAVTEIRSVSNAIKYNYNVKLARKNRDKIQVFKTWRQNKSLSKEYRRGHDKVNGIRLPLFQTYTVPVIVPRKSKNITKYIKIREEKMLYPHDPKASAENVIGCNCDMDYFMVYKL
jgi:hypothetical protein